jgi:type VI secretion system secreted protein VgrG
MHLTDEDLSRHVLLRLQQKGRLLRSHFPRNDGPDAELVVNTLHAREELSRGFRFDVELLSDDASIALKGMIGKMMTVSLVRDDGTERHFNGYITEFRYVKTDGGFVYYNAVLEPWLAFTKLRQNCVSFKGCSVIGMMEQIFCRYEQRDWKVRIDADLPTVSCMNQYNETDHNHLHRRWEAAGLHYWYEHRADGHTLWLSDDSTQAGRIDACAAREVEPGTIPYRAFAGSFECDGIYRWEAVRRLGSSATALASFDYKRPHPFVASRESENQQGNEVPACEQYENLGEYGYRDGPDGEALARRRMEEADRARQYFEAAGNDRSAMPGRCFVLADHHSATMPWPVLNMAIRDPIGEREYLITSADHSAANNIHSAGREPSYYKNHITCLRRTIRWRPGRNFNSTPPPAPGVQTAIVTGPPGEEIYTDSLGRVKIQFHWDRDGQHDDNSSAWVRVAMPMAGAQFGQIGLPRVGHEVVVQFLAENPDRPIITGVVYNAVRETPWKLPEQRALSGLRSKELGGSRHNQLVLDDTAGQIQAQLRSDHLHSQLSLGQIHRIDSNAGHQEERGAGFELRTDGHGVTRAGQGLLITTDANAGGNSASKSMPQTTMRLMRAHMQHDAMAELAQQHGIDDGSAQAKTAVMVSSQNKQIKGAGEHFPELTAPHVVISSSAGIAANAAETVHVASGAQVAVTAGANISITAQGGMFASVRQGLRLFTHKLGLKLIAASGDIDLHALADSVNLLAKMQITQTANRITITAKEEIMLNGGGSYFRLSSDAIELGSKGAVTYHGAQHEFLGAKGIDAAIAMPPRGQLKGSGIFNLSSHEAASGRLGAGMPFRLYKNGSIFEEGVLDSDGNARFEHQLEEGAEYEVEMPNRQRYSIPSADVPQNDQLAGHRFDNPGGLHE